MITVFLLCVMSNPSDYDNTDFQDDFDDETDEFEDKEN